MDGGVLDTTAPLAWKAIMGYESVYRNHISPSFGSLALEQITRPAVQVWLMQQSPASARNHFRVLSLILNGAVDDGCLDVPVPLSRMRFPRRDYVPMEQIICYTRLQVNIAFFQLWRNYELNNFVALLVTL